MKKIALLALAALMLMTCGKTAPVNYKLWYDWPERYLPDFSTLGAPDQQGTKSNIDLRGFDDTRNHFCILFEAPFKVRTQEEYQFTLTTDDGSRFYVDGELLIVNDGAHGPIEKKVSKVLDKGNHDLKIEFFDFDKLQTLIFKYSTPTIAEREYDDLVEVKEDKLSDNRKFVKPQVKEAYKRFAAWKGTDETVVFPIITDVHTGARYSYKHIGFAAEAGRKFKADFMANLGDIGLNTYPATVDSVYAQFILDKTLEGMRCYNGIWLYCPGNHDWDGGQGKWLTEDFLSDFFQKPWEDAAGGNLHLVPGRTYGYLDLPAKQFRVVFLNSESSRTKGDYYYSYGDEQLAWLASVLDATPEDVHVLLLSHWMPHPLGACNEVSMNPVRKEDSSKMMDLLASYVGKVNLVGLFTGDTHVNFQVNVAGVNYFVSQGYGWNAPDMLFPGQDHAYFDYTKSLCIDVVAVKPATREVHTFRIGAGGADFDYVFDY
ncbi:MAG: metallophosphoesterase [Bacteroidales bacterium]|nr:metallophosphoesterase [Bacteroidales bacterium]